MAKKKSSSISGNATSAKPDGEADLRKFLSAEQECQLEKDTEQQRRQIRHAARRQIMELRPIHTTRLPAKAGKGGRKSSLPKARGVVPSSIVDSLKRDAIDKFGVDAVLTGDAVRACGIGIPAPFLLEYLLCLDVLPLGKTYSLVGEPESLKTALAYGLLRLFCEYGGFGAYIENEGRYNHSFMQTILREHSELVIPHECHTQEEWQGALLYYLKKVQEEMLGTASAPGPGRVQPVAFVVDSFSSILSKETQEKVLEEGHANRAHPVEALKNTQLLKMLPGQLSNWPFALIFTNQLKRGVDQQGRPIARQGGGCQLQFAESVQLRLRKLRQQTSEATGETVVDVDLTCQRNTLGPGKRQALARMKWNFEVDPETGLKRQVTTWDWNWALTNLLHKQTSKRIKDAIRDLLRITFPRESALTASAASPVLGVPASSPISWSEMGKLIQGETEIMDQLRDIFDIQPRTLFKPAVDYLQQVQRAQQDVLQVGHE